MNEATRKALEDAGFQIGNAQDFLGITDLKSRLELAQCLFREFRSRCFWHSPKDLVITEELIPFVVKGLRANGGRRGFILSGLLR